MNSQPLSNYARLALIATVVSLMTACAHVRDDYDPYPYHSSRASYYDYWYYPAVDSYYDTRTRYYIYYERDRWVHARALPPRLRPHLGHHVNIRSPHDRPYEQHSRHRAQYAPERYSHTTPGDRGSDVRQGQSRKGAPVRDHDDRYREHQERDRNGQTPLRDRNDARVPAPAQKAPGVRDQENRPQKPNTRFQAAPDRREPPASVAPVRPETKTPKREIRNETARNRNHDGDVRQSDARDGGDDNSRSRNVRRDPSPDSTAVHPGYVGRM
jgi:hypothetical protein